MARSADAGIVEHQQAPLANFAVVTNETPEISERLDHAFTSRRLIPAVPLKFHRPRRQLLPLPLHPLTPMIAAGFLRKE